MKATHTHNNHVPECYDSFIHKRKLGLEQFKAHGCKEQRQDWNPTLSKGLNHTCSIHLLIYDSSPHFFGFGIDLPYLVCSQG